MKILVLGRAKVGKRYFMNKIGANYDLHLDVPMIYYAQDILMERPTRQIELRKYMEPKYSESFAWQAVILVAGQSDTVEQLHTARNLLFWAHLEKPKAPIVVIFHKGESQRKSFSFEKRKSLLELDRLPRVLVFDLDYANEDDVDVDKTWVVRVHKALTWVAKHA